MEHDLSTTSQTSNSSTREFLTEKYTDQLKRWPKAGKHILAQFTDEYVCFIHFLIKKKVIVYQAFNHPIANYAVEHQVIQQSFC